MRMRKNYAIILSIDNKRREDTKKTASLTLQERGAFRTGEFSKRLCCFLPNLQKQEESIMEVTKHQSNQMGELRISAAEQLLPRAWEGRGSLLRVSVSEGVTELPDYLFSECRNLTEVILPKTLRRVGNHVFYNCRKLKSLTLPAQLESIGDGAFKNCESLSKIIFEEMSDEADQCVRKILFDIEQETELLLCYEDGMAKLIMPQYDYQYVANEPARIFSEVSYGTGHYYRKCINSRSIEFQTYDQLFERAKRDNSARTVSEICFARLEYPYALSDIAAAEYRGYLTKELMTVVRRLLRESISDPQALDKLVRLGDFGVLTAENLPLVIAQAGEEKNAEAVAWLMEYRRVHFAPQKKEFDL